MSDTTSAFAFVLTNAGSESALKQEVAASAAGWRSGYQQRGFVMFKAPSDAQPLSLHSLDDPPAFARRSCLSLGKAATRDEAGAMLAGAALLVHHVRLVHGRLSCVDPRPTRPPAFGDVVGTVVQLGPQEYWAGLHRTAPLLSPDPGGSGGLRLPDDAPSRAWLKLEEAIRFFGLRFSPHDVVVELGCAPGGIIHALLQRGVSVIGVDPARLAPSLLAACIPAVPDTGRSAPWLVHCRKPAALVSRLDLGARPTWFVSDMTQSPDVVLRECGRFITMCPGIRSALITLKLTELTLVADKPRWLAALREMGFRTIRLQQLGVHHRELALLALER